MSYVNLINNVWLSNQLIKPKSFVENISKRVQKYYTLQQQDSHECLLYVLDVLHRGLAYEIDVEIKGDVKDPTDALMQKSLQTWKSFYEKEYSYIVETFNGLTYNEIKCSGCDCSEDVFEPFNCLSIDIPLDQSTVKLQEIVTHKVFQVVYEQDGQSLLMLQGRFK